MQFPRLKDLREDEQLKQEDIAKQLSISQQQYSLYETGKREIPLSMCIILSKFYNVSLDYIAGLTNNKAGIGYNLRQTHNGIGNNVLNLNGGNNE